MIDIQKIAREVGMTIVDDKYSLKPFLEKFAALYREAVVQELLAGSDIPVGYFIDSSANDAKWPHFEQVSNDYKFDRDVVAHYTESQLAGAVLRATIDERERVIQILDGIDRTEFDEPEGWWETSSGASFGAGILRQIGGGE